MLHMKTSREETAIWYKFAVLRYSRLKVEDFTFLLFMIEIHLNFSYIKLHGEYSFFNRPSDKVDN